VISDEVPAIAPRELRKRRASLDSARMLEIRQADPGSDYRLGFTVTREPRIPGISTRPDFLMERNDGAF
jgi:hypothetical protein